MHSVIIERLLETGDTESCLKRCRPVFGDVQRARSRAPANPVVFERMSAQRRTDAPREVPTAFAPVETRAAERPARRRVVRDAELREQRDPDLREPRAVIVEYDRTALAQGVGERDRERSGKVIVTGARLA